MSDSVWPHRWQPTRLPHPWDSPGKNTGVGCHFLLQCMKVKSESEVAQLCLTLQPHGLQPTRLLCPWDFAGKTTGVGCHHLLCMMYSAHNGDNIHLWHTPFLIWNQSVVPCPVLTVASWRAYRFLKRQVKWSGTPIFFGEKHLKLRILKRNNIFRKADFSQR